MVSGRMRGRAGMTAVAPLLIGALTAARALGAGAGEPSPDTFTDPAGMVESVSSLGALDRGNPFFQTLGTNGRRCSTCHEPSVGWTITPPHVQARFEASQGLDPVFRPIDAATCETADVSTIEARRTAYRLLLAKAVLRVSLPVPARAEFGVVSIDDPYGCSTPRELSMYRRPLPATNLRFLTTVMWDGRETVPGRPLAASLASQASDAILRHTAPAGAPTARQLDAIVGFETGLHTAQQVSLAAGKLDADGGRGGAGALAAAPDDVARVHAVDRAVLAAARAVIARVGTSVSYGDAANGYTDEEGGVLVNESGELLVYAVLTELTAGRIAELRAAGLRPEVTNEARRLVQGWLNAEAAERVGRLPFVQQLAAPAARRPGQERPGQYDPVAFDLFTGWPGLRSADGSLAQARASVARGEQLFNVRPFMITGVAGFNDTFRAPVLRGTCTTCHNTPNVGNYALGAPLDIGVASASRRTPDLPLFTFRCTATGRIVRTTDPGRGLITGKCEDLGKVKVPILRGLAARAPYFHDGSATTLEDVVAFYDSRFQLRLTPQDIADLVAFLRSL